MHIIIFPLTIVKASFLIEKLSFSISHPITFKAFIATSILILLDDKISIVIRASRTWPFTNLWNGAEWLVGLGFAWSRFDIVVILWLLVDHDVRSFRVSIVIRSHLVKDLMHSTWIFYAFSNRDISYILENFKIIFSGVRWANHTRNCRDFPAFFSLGFIIFEHFVRWACRKILYSLTWSTLFLVKRYWRLQGLNWSFIGISIWI